MNKQYITFLFSIVFLTASFMRCQTLDSDALKEVESVKNMAYQMGSELFKSRKLHYKTDADYSTPWDKNTPEQRENLKNALETIVKNGTLEIKESRSSKKSIVFNSQVPEIEDLTDIFKLLPTETNLMDANQKEVNINERGSTFYGSIFNSSTKNGQQVSSNQITIKSSFRVTPKVESAEITGSVQFLASFPSEFEKVLITPADVGKEYSLGKEKFSVVAIHENNLFLEFHEEDSKTAFEFKFVNLDKDGNEIAQLSYNELEKLKENNEETLDISSFEGMGTIPEQVFGVFNENPTIAQDDFNTKIHKWVVDAYKTKGEQRLSQKMFDQSYIVVTSAGPIKNCYIYLEHRDIQKEFRKEL